MSERLSTEQPCVDPTTTARAAILDDLRKRYQAKDVNVLPMNPDSEHRWYKPQANYFSGAGACGCPVCKRGVISYHRSSYNGHVTARCSTQDCVWWQE